LLSIILPMLSPPTGPQSQPRAVTNDACAQTPTRGCLQKGVGVSTRLAEGVSPQDLSWGVMICWRIWKNTTIYHFYGFAR
jgi:hypothetical protein